MITLLDLVSPEKYSEAFSRVDFASVRTSRTVMSLGKLGKHLPCRQQGFKLPTYDEVNTLGVRPYCLIYLECNKRFPIIIIYLIVDN